MGTTGGRRRPSGLLLGVFAGLSLAALETLGRYLPALAGTEVVLLAPRGLLVATDGAARS